MILVFSLHGSVVLLKVPLDSVYSKAQITWPIVFYVKYK